MTMDTPSDIAEGMDDEAAGRVTPARQVIEAAKHRLAREESDAAIQRGIDDLEAGHHRPWEDVKAELDAKFGFGKGSNDADIKE